MKKGKKDYFEALFYYFFNQNFELIIFINQNFEIERSFDQNFSLQTYSGSPLSLSKKNAFLVLSLSFFCPLPCG